MIIVTARRAFISDEGASAIIRPVQRCLRHVHDVRIFGIKKNPAEITIALNARILSAALPRDPAIIGAIQSVAISISGNYCKHSLAIRPYCKADPAHACGWQRG